MTFCVMTELIWYDSTNLLVREGAERVRRTNAQLVRGRRDALRKEWQAIWRVSMYLCMSV